MSVGDLSETFCRQRRSLKDFWCLWSKLGQEFRSDRTLQNAKGARRHFKILRDESFPLACLLKNLGFGDDVEFQLTAAGTSGCDAKVFSTGPDRYIEIKMTAPMWPSAKTGSFQEYGVVRAALVEGLGKIGLSNFGPRQSAVLGEDYADTNRMIPKDRLFAGCRNG